jgi:hypothetical protein
MPKTRTIYFPVRVTEQGRKFMGIRLSKMQETARQLGYKDYQLSFGKLIEFEFNPDNPRHYDDGTIINVFKKYGRRKRNV